MDALSTVRVACGVPEHHEPITRLRSHPVELSVWQRVDSELVNFNSVHHRYWWARHTGKALAVLLYNAGYSPQLQYRDLKFFAEVVAPNLGLSRDKNAGNTPTWPSFMTDDGYPVELSWDWGSKDKPPKVRYSVEPIGPHAGSTLDPANLHAGVAFQEQLNQTLPSMRLEWYRHFEKFFNGCKIEGSSFIEDKKDNNTTIFYAFDLLATEVTAKIYFFPKMRATIYNQSNLEVLVQAIQEAPYATEDNLKAASIFRDFCSDEVNQALEYEMLAIDLVDPLQSRLKIYFRCRETTFNSVIRMMTFGGRVENPQLHRGLADFYHLWKCLFGPCASLDQPLGDSQHRTAGILYNAEFKLGDLNPSVKVYLPVRHYAASDAAVIQGLKEYLTSHQQGTHMPAYARTMNTVFTSETLRTERGKHTYIGCNIPRDGSLRVVSYFKP
jgi:DMATS type aromatic prenyltransferase